MQMTKPGLAMLFAVFVFSSALAQPNSQEGVLFQAVNRERQSMGLPALRWNEALATAAQQHASAMAKQRTVSHTLPGEPSLPGRATRAGAHYSWISENVVASEDAEAAHTAFMHSPNHRANILDGDMDSVGIGVAERGGQVYVVEDFSKAK
jgi:uncharacterized protein YkwD